MKEIILQCSNVSAGYNKKNFITDLSLEIYKGDFLCLIGQNGAGKSTVLKLLSSILKPYSGEIRLRGQNILNIGHKKLSSQMAVVRNINGIIPDFLVKDFVSFGAFPHGRALSKIKQNICSEIIKQTGIDDLSKRIITTLSSGEFQLVQIARALLQSRDILLLDEPVSNLDYRHTVEVMNLLKEFNHQGTTIVCAIHDLNTALNFCNRIVALKKGKILFDGKPEELNNKLLEKIYDIDFISIKNPVTGKLMVSPLQEVTKKYHSSKE
ncbi:MAG: ABC transporter ATP-binding protein [Spirochaetes bacterium]|nr:ABC transporter ATP-binding protein [Spirochaetota bacterium]